MMRPSFPRVGDGRLNRIDVTVPGPLPATVVATLGDRFRGSCLEREVIDAAKSAHWHAAASMHPLVLSALKAAGASIVTVFATVNH
jgi:hypothetical protein